MSDEAADGSLERVPTGIPGLDAIMNGGFLRSGVYLLLARPGAGKTIMANQICFSHVASGGRALFVTLLAESHARLIAQIRGLDFFDPSRVGKELAYIAGYQALEKDHLQGLTTFLRKVVRDHKATLLVIDGMVTAHSVAESDLEMKRFVHELQVFAELVGCTTLLLTGPGMSADEQYALRTMVDGLVELHLETADMEAVRSVEIVKSRGSPSLMGRHLFTITDAGITIYPRLESLAGAATMSRPTAPGPPAGFGIEGLDAMLGGGLRTGSVTMVLGSPGSGKTLLGSSLLAAGGREGEVGTYFGFFETPADLCRKAEALGIGLTEHVKSGRVEILWQSPLNVLADELAEKLVENVRKRSVKRVVIDGLGGLKGGLVYPARATRFFGALCNELRSQGATVLLTDEMQTVGEVEVPRHGLTAMLDNIVFLRHVELGARLHKLLSVVKMREGSGDPSLREFSIAEGRGFVVSPASESAQAILSALARGEVAPTAAKDR